jgi:hypothetical protein
MCGSLSLHAILRFTRSALQSTSCPALEIAFCYACLLGASLPSPLSLGQGQWSVGWPPAVSVLWWFPVCSSTLQNHLTLDAVHWPRRWALCSAACPTSGTSLSPFCCQPSCFSTICLLIVRMKISSFPCPPSPVQHFHPLCCVLVFSLFIVQFVWVFFL